jgi:MFS family permease
LVTDIKGDWAEAYVATAMVGLFFAAIRISDTGRLNRRSAAVLGFWWGLALLLSPALASVLGSFILVGALRFLRESPRRYVEFVAVLGIVAALVISPWPIRNAIRLGSPIWAKDNFGIMLLNSNHPGAGWDVYGNEKFIEETTPSWQPAVALKLKAAGEVAYDKSQAEEAKQWIRANPGTFAGLVALRAFHFWFPPGLNAFHTVLEAGLTLVAIVGLCMLYFRHRAAAMLILGIWICYPPVYYIMLWSSRYRYPINWTFLLTAAVALDYALSTLTGRRTADSRGVQ